MIPRASILSDIEFVRIAFCWRYWALCHSVYSIHLHSMKLSDTMPMDCCSIILEIICDGHLEFITPACLDPGAWILPVERLSAGLKVPVGIDRHLTGFEMVRPLYTSGPFLVEIREYIKDVI